MLGISRSTTLVLRKFSQKLTVYEKNESKVWTLAIGRFHPKFGRLRLVGFKCKVHLGFSSISRERCIVEQNRGCKFIRNFALYNFASENIFLKAHCLQEKWVPNLKACDWSKFYIGFQPLNRVNWFEVSFAHIKESPVCIKNKSSLFKRKKFSNSEACDWSNFQKGFLPMKRANWLEVFARSQ